MSFRTRLFLLTLGVVALTLVSAYVYLAAQARRDATDRLRHELEIRLSLAEVRLDGVEATAETLGAWDAVADELGRASRARITLINAGGEVLGDSEVALADLAGLENHGTREEVLKALGGELGTSARPSHTVARELLYVAKPWRRRGEQVGALRISAPLDEIASSLDAVHRNLIIAGVLGLLVAFAGSSLTAHFVASRTRKLTAVAERLAAGDLDARGEVEGEGEFSTLARTLNGLAASLHQTLAELRDERDRMTRVLSSMNEGVLLIDQEARIQLVNAAAQEMLLLGSHTLGERAFEVLTDAELSSRLKAALDGQNSHAELQLGPTGLRVLANVRRLRQRSGALAVLVDITHRRRLETVRQEFVANASHELRTPTTAIISAVETLVGPAEGDAAAARTFVDIIQRNAQRLAALVDDLLELSQLESESLVVDLATVELRAVVDASLAGFQGQAQNKRIRLDNEVPEACTAWANSKGLEHVLGNLLQNAINYCPVGSRVSVSTRPLDGEIELCVADDGPGIAREHLDRLFERFYRVDTGRSRSVGGTGLGLSIVRHWVEAMGGSVRVTSEVGRGTTFHVALRGRGDEPQAEPADDATV